MNTQGFFGTLRGYFNSSWEMLSSDDGWLKPVFLLTIATFVPIVGPLFSLGYCLEWARLTAWGINAHPKQKNIAYGECIKSGFRGLIVIVVYTLVVLFVANIVFGLVGWIPLLGRLVNLVRRLMQVFVAILAYVAAIRATIYQRIGAGFQMDRVWDMVSADYMGLLAIVVIQILWLAGTTLIATLAASIFIGPAIPAILEASQLILDAYNDIVPAREQVVELTRAIAQASIPAITGITLFATTSANMMRMLIMNAVGLWTRQFDVPRWSTSEAPLPIQMV